MNSTEANVIGIDVSKAQLDCCIGRDNSSFRIGNTPAAIKSKLLKLAAALPDLFLVVESTGKYHTPLFQVATGLGIPVAIVNPKRVRDFAKALGQLAKTDNIDAKIIARYALTVAVKPTPPLSKELQALRSLVARRNDIVRMITQERNRLGDIEDKILIRSLKRHIHWLLQECKALEAQIKATVQSQEFSSKLTLLRGFRGIGDLSAAALIAFLPELGTLSKSAIAALVGVAPFADDSGSSCKGKRRIWGGRSAVRTALYMCALTAIRWNSNIKPFYQTLKKSGKPNKLALVAAMRKIIIILNAMLRDGAQFRQISA
jgi:transposase